MVEEVEKLLRAVEVMKDAVLGERWAEAELSLLDAEKQIGMLHRAIAEKHRAALQSRKDEERDRG